MSNLRQIELTQHLKLLAHSANQQPVNVVCKSAIFLLENIPSTRHAVFEYFNTIYELSIALALKNQNFEELNNINLAIDEIQQKLINLAKNDTWTTELSTWSLELMGILCTKYDAHLVKSQVSQISVIDSLQIWSQSKPVKNLLDIVELCISTKKNDVLAILFNIIIKYSPFIDWCLTQLGAICPFDTISMLIIALLKEYIAVRAQNLTTYTKFNSLVIILNYFLNIYPQYVYNTLSQLFQAYLSGNFDIFKQFSFNIEQLKQHLISFLIKLFNSSSTLLYLLSSNFESLINIKTLNEIKIKLTEEAQISKIELQNETINVLKQLANGSYEIFIYLINMSTFQNGINEFEDLRLLMQDFLKSFLDDMNSALFTVNEKILFIDDLKSSYKIILSDFFREDSKNHQRKKWLFDLLTLIGMQGPAHISQAILSELLISKQVEVSWIARYRKEVENFYPNCMKQSISSLIKFFKINNSSANFSQKSIRDQIAIDITFNNNEFQPFLKNLIELYDWETKNDYSGLNIKQILQESGNFIDLMSCLNLQDAKLLLQLYDLVDMPPLLSIHECLNLSNILVKNFYETILSENETKVKIELIHKLKCFIKLTCNRYNDLFKNIFLRTTINALYENPVNLNIFQETKDTIQTSLYKQNCETKPNPNFKSRLIDDVHHLKAKNLQKQNEITAIFNNEIAEIIQIICTIQSPRSSAPQQGICNRMQINEKIICNLAQFFVEYLTKHCPDYQWPTEDSIKLHIERDIVIQKQFDESKLNWMILNLLTKNKNALIICSPLIRSLLANLIVQWEIPKETPTINQPKLLEMTTRLLNLLNLGDLLPKPQCFIVEIIPLINSYETYTLLLNIWKYLSNTLQIDDSIQVVNEKNNNDHLRNIFLKNLNKLGSLYIKFFKNT